MFSRKSKALKAEVRNSVICDSVLLQLTFSVVSSFHCPAKDSTLRGYIIYSWAQNRFFSNHTNFNHQFVSYLYSFNSPTSDPDPKFKFDLIQCTNAAKKPKTEKHTWQKSGGKLIRMARRLTSLYIRESNQTTDHT